MTTQLLRNRHTWVRPWRIRDINKRIKEEKSVKTKSIVINRLPNNIHILEENDKTLRTYRAEPTTTIN
jgi:hypothetical protein